MIGGTFKVGQHLAINGPTRSFRFARRTHENGLRIFVATVAASGVWGGARIYFEFLLAGEWHRTLVVLKEAQRFWQIQESAAISGRAYRFVLDKADASTDLQIEIASPWELVFDGSDT